MALDLGARLVTAGLLSREQLAGALRTSRGGALAAALVAGGLPEEALAGFFVAEGLGPLLDESALAASVVARRITQEMAQALLALPVRQDAQGLVVAVADPTDTHVLGELARATGARIVPAVAKLSVLRAAIARAWVGDVEEPAVELVTRRRRPEPAEELEVPIELGTPVYASGKASGKDLGTKVAPIRVAADEPAVPLTRTKPVYAGRERERTKTQDMLKSDEPPKEPAQVPTVTVFKPPSSPPPGVTRPMPMRAVGKPLPEPPPPRSPSFPSMPEPGSLASEILAADKWSSLPPPPGSDGGKGARTDAPSARPAEKLAPARASVAPRKTGEPTSPGDPGPILSGLRATTDRDEAVRLACEGALPACRCVVFLALKKDVLQGREARGGGVSREAVRNLWIPTTSASIFRDAVTRGIAHAGPYGTTSADGIYRAAIGSRGGDVVVQPILVSGKPVGVLCADDVRFGPRGEKRVELVARALGEALERIIVSGKKT